MSCDELKFLLRRRPSDVGSRMDYFSKWAGASKTKQTKFREREREIERKLRASNCFQLVISASIDFVSTQWSRMCLPLMKKCSAKAANWWAVWSERTSGVLDVRERRHEKAATLRLITSSNEVFDVLRGGGERLFYFCPRQCVRTHGLKQLQETSIRFSRLHLLAAQQRWVPAEYRVDQKLHLLALKLNGARNFNRWQIVETATQNFRQGQNT